MLSYWALAKWVNDCCLCSRCNGNLCEDPIDCPYWTGYIFHKFPFVCCPAKPLANRHQGAAYFHLAVLFEILNSYFSGSILMTLTSPMYIANYGIFTLVGAVLFFQFSRGPDPIDLFVFTSIYIALEAFPLICWNKWVDKFYPDVQMGKPRYFSVELLSMKLNFRTSESARALSVFASSDCDMYT